MFVSEDIKYIGVNDRKVDLFEGQYKVPAGMAYNSYLILDEKVAVLDTVDRNFTGEWLEKLSEELGSRVPDYLVVQHMEPDHSASIGAFLQRYPRTTVVGNAKTFRMIEGFFGKGLCSEALEVSDGQSLALGTHVLTFVFAPMVHWPEVMVTYDQKDRVLFSADAFGKFGALDAKEEWTDEARRYYIGIVGKYGMQVQALLKKAAALDIRKICPLHGPVLQEDLSRCLELYGLWSSYQPEEKGVCIAYTSVYGNTKKAVALLEEELKEKGIKTEVYDLARSDWSKALASAFRYDRLVLATTTYNSDIFPCMRGFIEKLTERNYQNRKVGMIENGSWAPTAARVMCGLLEKSKNLKYLESPVTVRSAVNGETEVQIRRMAEELLAD